MPLGNTKSNLGIFGEKIKGKAGSSKSQRRLQRNNWDCIRLGERPGRPGRGGESEGEQSLTITSPFRTNIDKIFSSYSSEYLDA